MQPQPPLHPHPPRPKALPQSPHPPHKRRRQIIHIQLLEPHPRQPLLQPQPLLSKRSKRIISHMQLLEPQPQSPHPLHPPQFVAAKSLINNPPIKTFTIQ